MQAINNEKRQANKWYVLRGKYLGNAAMEALSKEMKNRSQRGDENFPPLEYFAPCLERKQLVDGVLKSTDRPFGGYVFVKGTKNNVQVLRSTTLPTFNMVRSLSDESSYMTVSELEMSMFKFTVSLYNGHAPFVEVSKDTLEKGDYVRVTHGQFANVEGILLTSQGKEGGRVIVSVCNGIAIPTLEIQPEYLQVISFGKDSRHIYQTLDSYHPYIRRAMANKLSNVDIEEKDLVRVKKFVARYGKVNFKNDRNKNEEEPSTTKRGKEKVDDKKIRCRYYAYMLMSYMVLGVGGEGPIKYYVREINQLIPFITNATTSAFISCALYAATKINAYLDDATRIVDAWNENKLSKKQRDVKSDIDFYKQLLEKRPV